MPERQYNIILGPPGTGKTTTLINIVEEALANGIKPEQVCYLAFTRRAAKEAVDRCIEKFGINRGDLPYFRTIHSLCFQRLNMGREQVVQKKHLIGLGDDLGIDIRCKGSFEEGGIWGSTVGDRIVYLENLSRITQHTLQETWEHDDADGVYFEELETFAREYKRFKSDHDLLDFTDMLEMFSRELVPSFKILIVDEAQDLSSLQWGIIEQLNHKTEVAYVAGDDDQSIYGWAGADIPRFIRLQGSVRVLDQSYRLPQAVYELASGIQKSITESRPKSFVPTSRQGRVSWSNDIEEVDMSSGTWLLLARNTYQLREYESLCTRRGIPHETNYTKKYRERTVKAIRLWTKLTRGDFITGSETKVLRDYIDIKGEYKEKNQYDLSYFKQYGGITTDAIWHEALTGISELEREFWISCLRAGEDIIKTPRIRISTIHGAKGAEAENVLLLSDISYKAWERYQENPDDEHRVFYVGVTRAKESLTIISPKTRYYYDIP